MNKKVPKLKQNSICESLNENTKSIFDIFPLNIKDVNLLKLVEEKLTFLIILEVTVFKLFTKTLKSIDG